ncbi:MAG: radical SAM protein, partial [archaeon]
MKINRIELFAFSYTDKCNIKCAHCIAGSSPEKHKKLDLERLLLFVKQLKEFNIKSFEITGGEALVFFDEVIELLSVGKQAGISSSVISNGSWGFSEENAERVVSELADAGLKDLFISSDEFHLEFVPAKSVFNIVDAVMKRKEPIKVFLRFCESKNYSFLDFLTENAGYFKNLKKKYPKKNLRVLTQFLAPLGRAFKKVPKENYVIKAKLAENPCNLVKRPFLNADGNIFCCCNGPKLNNPLTAPYFLGNFYSDSPAEFIKNYEESFFVFYLRTK